MSENQHKIKYDVDDEKNGKKKREIFETGKEKQIGNQFQLILRFDESKKKSFYGKKKKRRREFVKVKTQLKKEQCLI